MAVPPQVFPSSYNLVCPELDESYPLYGHTTSIHEFFYKCNKKDETWFWNMFARPAEGVVRTQQLWCGHVLGRHRSLLEQLPTELIDHILDSLVDEYDIPWKTRHDILALGLSSVFLYPLVLAYIHRSQAKQQPASSFAGKSVGFYTEESAENVSWTSLSGNQSRLHGPPRTTRFPTQPDQMWFQSIAEVREKWNVLDDQQWGQLEEDISKMYLYPQDRVWVLRNFTTRQVVRSDALTPPAGTIPTEAMPAKAKSMKDKFRHLKDKLITRHDTVPGYSPLTPQAPTLAQVFLVQTARADPSNSILDSEKVLHFQHGAWAGHAFDVVTFEQYTRDVEAIIMRWTNISAFVAADVGHLRWCVGQAEIAKSWPEYEEQFWRDIIHRDRQQWRWLPDTAIRYMIARGLEANGVSRR